MKKLLILLLVLVMVSFSGCIAKPLKNINSNTTANKPDTESADTKDTSTPKDTTENTESEPVDKLPQIKPSTDDKGNSNKDNNSQPDTQSTPTTPSDEKEETTEYPPATVTTPFGEVLASACYQFDDLGRMTDWLTVGDYIFATFKSPNLFAAFDSNSGEVLIAQSLPGRPAEFRFWNDELWISFPDLKCIKVYDSETLSIKESISFDKTISSFDLYGDYIIYATDSGFGNAYRYNVKTGESIEIKVNPNKINEFYSADVLIDPERKVVYIGDSFLSVSSLYCFDIETLELKTYYNDSNTAWGNLKRRTFLVDGSLYWSGRQFDSKDLSTPIKAYEGYGTHHVDEYFVVTTAGIFLRAEGTPLLYGGINSAYSTASITASGNIMVMGAYSLFIITS